ncbi:MAG: thiamine kinase-like enzyme, partial [Gammaproteobacteria bacterium]
FKVHHADKDYVVRLGDDIPEHLVWRDNEGSSSITAAQCGFSPAVFHREAGVLVIEFIDGKVFTEDDVKQPHNLKRIVSLLQDFHHKMPRQFSSYPTLFWVFQVLRHYNNKLADKHSPHMAEMAEYMQISDQLESAVGPISLVFGHNDLLAANFIDDGDKIWLIDFDYAGFNSPLFDLANLASNSELPVVDEKVMLEQYFDLAVDDQTWHRYNAMKCASLLRETVWSMVSEHYSKLDFDFTPYTVENRDRFERVYDNYQIQFK